METQEREVKQRELDGLKARVAELESELTEPQPWQATGYYATYYATTGFILGIFGAAASLLFNVIGSALVNQHPLRLIQVYLTFPLKERALELDGGLALTIGCCLYLGTGMLLGVVFQLILGRYVPHANLPKRLAVATVLSLAVWVIGFYGILTWLQPALFGGNWIVEQIPPWVAALTHLIFGWTMALVYPLGQYIPYSLQTEKR